MNAAVLVLVAALSAHAAEPGQEAGYPASVGNVVWDAPSTDSSGSMPLGNGDVGVNVWVEPNGDLVFYISKTDAWNENARLLKLGRVRIKLLPALFVAGQSFEQRLKVELAEVQIRAWGDDQNKAVRVWVDANRPVIHVETQSTQECSIQASLELWRTEKRELKGRELFSAYGMNGAPHPIFEYPDTVLPPRNNRIIWFHRNPDSIWTETMKLQGLESLMGQLADPLLNRTFGGVMWGPGLVASDPTTLASVRPSQQHRVSVSVLTAHTATVDEWVQQAEQLVAEAENVGLTQAREAHLRWWQEFWNRSWIEVHGPVSSGYISRNALPLRIGADSDGRNQFKGYISRARVFREQLRTEEIATLAQGGELSYKAGLIGDWVFDRPENGVFRNRAGETLPAKMVGQIEVTEHAGRLAAHFTGDGWVEIAPDPSLDLSERCTLDAWICPDVLPPGGGRIIDKSQAGTANGYLLDTYPGHSLRFIIEPGTLVHDAKLPVGKWTHVAATYDCQTGCQRLYVDGKLVAEANLGGDAEAITRGYVLQRFINACAGRGAFPIKFNGSIFTVDAREGEEQFNADYRRWGGPYWFQNTRLAYWPMLACGDFDLMLPFFRMYLDALPLCQVRTRLYFNHGGAFFPETMYFWGAYANENYGWNRGGKHPSQVDNTYIRWYWSCGLELATIALDYYAYTQDDAFLSKVALPLADAVVRFYDEHYGRDGNGKLLLKPAQALETWQDVVNPLPDIAGLRFVLDKLLALPPAALTPQQVADWQRLRSELPELPSKTENGQTFLLPAAELLGPIRNIENPELYAIFPFRIYGLGKPDLELGRLTFDKRRFKRTGGWTQDAIQAAYLGLTETAAKYVAQNFATHHKGSRFPAFWGPNYDWVPDQDHGGVAMMALQAMLMQCEGEKILLFPAWPKEWDVRFRLHAPMRTTVQGEYRDGKLLRLALTPRDRQKDIDISKNEAYE